MKSLLMGESRLVSSWGEESISTLPKPENGLCQVGRDVLEQVKELANSLVFDEYGGTGVAVNPGDLVTSAKMNLKMENARDINALGLLDQSGVGTEELLFSVTENLTADRTLTLTVNNVDRTIDLSGNLTLAGALTTAAAFTTAGAFALTLTATGITNVTLPTTGTLMTLAGIEVATNKTFTSPTINGATLSGTLSGAVTFSGATVTLTGGTLNLTSGAGYVIGTTDNFAVTFKTNAVNKLGLTTALGQFTVYQTTANLTLIFSDPAAARNITFNDPLGHDAVAYLAATQTFTNHTWSGGTFSGTIAGTPTFSGATLTHTGNLFNFTAGGTYTLGTTDNNIIVIKTNAVSKLAFTTTLGSFTIYQTTGNYTVNWSDPAAGRIVTFPDPGGADSVCYLAATQNISNKTYTSVTLNITAGAAFTTGTTDNFTYTVKTNAINKFGFTVTLGDFTVYQTTANYTLRFSDPAAARVITFPDPLGADSVCYIGATQTLVGKTLTTPTIGQINGLAQATSLSLFSHVTGGAAAQRDVVVGTGDAAAAQAIANRMLFRSNAAQGAAGIVAYESILLSRTVVSSIINDSEAGAPASAQIYSGAAGQFNLASGAGNAANAVVRLTISNAATAVVTWASCTHTGIVLSGNIDAGTTNSVINLNALIGGAGTVSMSIRSHVTGGAPLQRDVVIRTGDAAAAQAAVDRLNFRSNAAQGSAGISFYEGILLDRTVVSVLVKDSAAAAPSSAQIYSSAAGVFDLASGGGNDVIAVNRLSIANGAGTVVATWSNVSHTGLVSSGNLTFSAALDIIAPAATAAALQITDAATNIWTLDTRVAVDNVEVHTWLAPTPTFVSAAGSTWQHHNFAALTVTLTGGVGVTATEGLQLYVNGITLAANIATTVTTASTLYLAPPVVGANMTITNNRMITTAVAGCHLTAGGVWTDACGLAVKRDIKPVDLSAIPSLLNTVKLVTYCRRDSSDGEFTRFGVIADTAPDFLADSTHKGIAAIDMAGFALAAIKYLKAEKEKLEERIVALEARL